MSTVVNVHDFKTNYSRYLTKVKNGEVVTVGESGIPVAELRPLAPKPQKRVSGTLQGKISIADDFDETLPEWTVSMEKGIDENTG